MIRDDLAQLEGATEAKSTTLPVIRNVLLFSSG